MHIFVIFGLLIILNTYGEKTDSVPVYICPPCGLSCDLLEFEKTGLCHVCNMELIRAHEKDRFDAGVLQSFKEKGVFYLIIFFGIFQGLILFMFLTFSKRAKKKKSNKYLALLVVSFALGCGYYLLLEYRVIYENLWISFLPLKLFYIYGTALYFYVVTSTGKHFSKAQVFTHFSPALITIILGMLFLVFGVSPNSIWYGRYNLIIIDLMGSAHSMIYFIMSYRVVASYNKQIHHYVSANQQTFEWLQKLMIMLVPFFALWTLFLLYSFIQPGHHLNNYMFVFWILVGILIYWIGYRGYVQPELFILPDQAIKSIHDNEEDRQTLNPYIQALHNAMKISKLHLNQTLTRQDLADHLKISPNQLSYILNTLIGKSFYDFVNEYRVSEVMTKIEDPNNIHFTLERLAYDSGFNSKSSFNAIFKKVRGMTPRQYRKSVIAPSKF